MEFCVNNNSSCCIVAACVFDARYHSTFPYTHYIAVNDTTPHSYIRQRFDKRNIFIRCVRQLGVQPSPAQYMDESVFETKNRWRFCTYSVNGEAVDAKRRKNERKTHRFSPKPVCIYYIERIRNNFIERIVGKAVWYQSLARLVVLFYHKATLLYVYNSFQKWNSYLPKKEKNFLVWSSISENKKNKNKNPNKLWKSAYFFGDLVFFLSVCRLEKLKWFAFQNGNFLFNRKTFTIKTNTRSYFSVIYIYCYYTFVLGLQTKFNKFV